MMYIISFICISRWRSTKHYTRLFSANLGFLQVHIDIYSVIYTLMIYIRDIHINAMYIWMRILYLHVHIDDIWYIFYMCIMLEVDPPFYTLVSGESGISTSAQGWRNRTLIGHELLICSKMCFTKTDLVQ